MQKKAKRIVADILWSQVNKLRRKNKIIVIAVVGSIGKTSTKLAIARVLQRKYKILYQDGNYNDLVSVPLIFFDQKIPSLYNPLAWLRVFKRNRGIIDKSYPYEVVVIELGTDGPGQLEEFSKYLVADIGVLTSIAPEHMEYFSDLDAVAEEELVIADFSKQLIINKDMCLEKYQDRLKLPFLSYSIHKPSNIRLTDLKFEGQKSSFVVQSDDSPFMKADHQAISEPQLYSIAAAIAVAKGLGLTPDEIKEGLKNIKPVSGRMQQLKGIHDSAIIDDTYNASPEATKAALHTLYRMKAPAKFAILGNMNELGEYSKIAHKEVGELCDPKQLDFLVTIGPDANRYLAKAAESKGCNVKTFDDPYSAAEFLKGLIKPDSVILVKGSQNGVFAEEAVKSLLADSNDSSKLIRQSEHWLKVKKKAFGVN